MSCAYRHAAIRIATIAGIPLNLMLTAMDIARQRRVTFPDLPPDRLRTIAPLLGITPTCGNPQQVIARTQSALIALGTLHSTHPSVERWMAIATALLGVPEDHLPVPVHPEIMATVRAQWAAPPRTPRGRPAQGIAALWRGDSIPAELIDEAIRAGDRTAIVTWIAHGVWDDRFEAICQNLTEAEIDTIVRAGVVPDAVAKRVAQLWTPRKIPWDVFPFAMWDRVDNPDIARKGRARTAAAKLVRNPTLRDDHLIVAAAEIPWYARDVLVARHDLSDDRLIAAVATNAEYAHNVLCARHDLSDDRLIAAVATNAEYAHNVLCVRHDLSDDRLIAAVADGDGDPWYPWYVKNVLVARHDLSDDRLIAAVATDAACARDVLIARRDLRDKRLIAAVADGEPWHAKDVLVTRHDLRDKRLIAAVARDAVCARDVLCTRRDLRDKRLIAAAAESPWCARDVLCTCADLRTNTRLLAAIACDRALVDSVLAQVPDLRDHPILAAVRGPDGSSG